MLISGIGRRTEGGFTLLELLVVLAILAMLTAVLMPMSPGIAGAKTSRETAYFSGFLRSIQGAGMQRGEKRTIKVEKDRLLVQETSEVYQSKNIAGLALYDMKNNLVQPPVIVFYPDGSADEETIVLNIGGTSRSLTVDLLGRIHAE